jgi:hypothetical protein
MIVDGTYIKALNGRAGRNGGGAGLLAREGGVLRQRLHGEGEDNAPANDIEGHDGLVLVLVKSTVR